MMPILFELHGPMVSGKNQVQHTGTGKHYPNARFKAWRHEAGFQLLPQKMRYKYDEQQPFPLKGRLLLSCTYRPADARIRDVSGMLDAIYNILEYMKIIENDGQIRDVEWYQAEGEPGLVMVLYT